MSKRPTTQATTRSRLRSPFGQLRDLPIWSKLVLIMIVPTLATVVVGLTGLVERIDTSNTADQARTLAAVTNDAGGLVHALQDERAAATMLLGNAKEQSKQGYEDRFGATDAVAKSYRERRAALGNLPDSFRTLLSRIDNQLSDLPVVRKSVTDKDADVTLTATLAQYDTLIRDLISIRDFASQLAGDSVLSYEMRAATAVANAKEYLSQERIVVLRALAMGEMPPALRYTFTTTLTGQEQSLQTFNVVATPQQRTLLEQTVAGSDLYEAVKVQGLLQSLTGDRLPSTGVPTQEAWDQAMAGRANLMRTVEQAIDTETVSDATRIRDDVTRQVVVEATVLFGLLFVGILFALLVARSMNRSLRELRHGALTVAQYGLPQAVARLRDPSLATQMSPAQVAVQIAEPLPVRSRDEFGQVAEAFNAVHLEAVRTAAEQAALRSSVAQMFVNLARRSQILVDRLIGHLDRLERGEEDPDRLAELFQLDHLATRMRRNDENLLVLAGADSTRVQRDPAPLIDVLRAAQSEVEHYTRIEFGVVDRDLEIAAHAVNDLVHLVAELFDNATAFSPPDSVVVVEARRVGDRAVLYVEDHGIGVSAEQLNELNERLANPPMVDVAVSRMMGLVVVARLANRHGVTVELRPASDRGTVADVMLPSSVLVPRALVGRSPGVLPASGEPAAPASRGARAPYAPPLALESGQSQAPGRGGSGATAGGLLAGAAFTRGAQGSQPDAPSRSEAPPPPPAATPAPTSGGPPPRSLPAWSDLTGADAVGANGANGHEPFRAAPFSEPLPHRRAGEARTVPAEGDGSAGRPPVLPRQASRTPETPEHAAGATPVSGPPLWPPTGAAGAPVAGADPTSEMPPVRPPAGTPLVPGHASANAMPGRPAAPGGPAAGGQPAAPQPEARGSGPGTAPPPAGWATAAGQQSAAPHATAAGPPPSAAPQAKPAGPGQPPRATPTAAGGQPSPPAGAATGPAGAGAQARGTAGAVPPPASARPPAPAPTRPAGPVGDETIEMPIFRELESAWFRARPQPGRPARPTQPGQPGRPTAPTRPTTPAPPPAAQRPAAAETPQRPGSGTTVGSNTMAGSPGPGRRPTAGPEPAPTADDPTWRTAADDGWHAAAALDAPRDAGETGVGLPRRVPMAQLVPGGVDKPATASNRRTPDAVRGLLSAYHRGVQRGRTTHSADNPESTTNGPDGPQSGKEQEA